MEINFVPSSLTNPTNNEIRLIDYNDGIDEDIGFGMNVPSNLALCSMGSYAIELTYNVTIHNSGSPFNLEYWVDTPGDYIIDSKGSLKNKGVTSGSENIVKMETFYIGEGTQTISFSMVLPTADSSIIKNWFEIKR